MKKTSLRVVENNSYVDPQVLLANCDYLRENDGIDSACYRKASRVLAERADLEMRFQEIRDLNIKLVFSRTRKYHTKY